MINQTYFYPFSLNILIRKEEINWKRIHFLSRIKEHQKDTLFLFVKKKKDNLSKDRIIIKACGSVL